jgi:hypothetical protein
MKDWFKIGLGLAASVTVALYILGLYWLAQLS